MLYYFNVFIHIICAAFWVGGMLFLPLVVLPGIKDNPERKLILYKTGITFRFYGWITLFLLLLTGILNMYFKGIPFKVSYFIDNNYGKLISYKLIIFICTIILSLIHDFFIGEKAISNKNEVTKNKFLSIARWSGRMMLLLGLVAVFLGVAIARGGF